MSFLLLFWRILPLLIVLLGFLAAQFNYILFIDATILAALPYLLALILCGFASMFNRSRFIAPVIIALFAYHVIRERLQTPLSQDAVLALFTGLNLLFCMQLLFSLCWPEKGLFTRMGALFISLLLSGCILLWLVSHVGFAEQWLLQVSQHKIGFFDTSYWLSQVLMQAHGITLFLIVLFCLFRRSTTDFALLLTWLTGVLVFIDFSRVNVSSVCFSALFLGLFLLYQQSNFQVTYKDALTGISGRRALDDYLSTLGRHYTIAMLDVDHFKKFNDTYGHDVGDQVLKMVASKVAQVQGGGKAFRYGGEEFCIVFNRKQAAEAFIFLEAVRLAVQHYAMTLRSEHRAENRKRGKPQRGQSIKNKVKTVSVTISIGVANSKPGLTPQEVIKQADNLLYKAKEAGRNCTQMA